MYNLLLYVLPITYKRMLNFSIVFQDLKMEGSNPEYERLFYSNVCTLINSLN